MQFKERHWVNDIEMKDNSNKIKYTKYMKREVINSDGNDEITIPNFMGYFFWNKVQNLPLGDKIWMGLSGIVSKMFDKQFFKK